MIQENIQRVNKLKEEINKHPMCYDFIDDGRHFIIAFPDMDYYLDGVRTNYSEMGKIKALETLLKKIEYCWLDSYPSKKDSF
jgi:hypothetical protein